MYYVVVGSVTTPKRYIFGRSSCEPRLMAGGFRPLVSCEGGRETHLARQARVQWNPMRRDEMETD